MLMEMLWAVYFRVKLSENPSLQFIHRSSLNLTPCLTTEVDLDSDLELKNLSRFWSDPVQTLSIHLKVLKSVSFSFPFFDGRSESVEHLRGSRPALSLLAASSRISRLLGARWVTPGWFPITSPSSPSFFPLNCIHPPTPHVGDDALHDHPDGARFS